MILHGARLFPRRLSGPTGVKHSVWVRPLDRRRQRPCGWWMLDKSTGLRHGFIESRLGIPINADDLELDELVQRTVAAR